MVANIVVLLSLVLITGFTATRLAKWARLPHSVFLVLLGLVMGAVIQVVDYRIPSFIFDFSADIILLILLPPLIFESAYNLKLNDLKKNLIPILCMATLGLIISTLLVGFSFHYLFKFALFPALVFGALISATDPVAVVALFRELGAPKRLITLVEGESLFNDGTALVMYNLFLVMALSTTGSEITLLSGFFSFLKVVFGGIVVGFVIAQLTSVFLRLTDATSSAQIGLTVASAYLSFVVADHFFHVSGIFATLVVGLIMGHRARLELNREALHGMHSVWSLLALGANSMVFLLLGLLVDYNILLTTLPLIPGALIIIYLSRFVSVPVSLIPNNMFFSSKVNVKEQTVLVWGGLRGGLAIALVLLLPEGFPYKAEFMALATAFVLSTLLLNALTINKLLNLLGFNELSSRDEALLQNKLQVSKNKVFASLKQASELGALSPLVVELHNKNFNQQIEKISSDTSLLRHQEVMDFLLKEQELYNHQLEDRELGKSSYLNLIENLNSRLQLVGPSLSEALTYQASFLKPENSFWHFIYKLNPLVHRYLRFKYLDRDLEILFFQYVTINKVICSGEWSEKTLEITTTWRESCHSQLRRLFLHYPSWSKNSQGRFISLMLKAGVEHNFQHSLNLGIINDSVYSKGNEFLNDVVTQWLDKSKQSYKLQVPNLLMGVSELKSLPHKDIEKLSSQSTLMYFEAETQWKPDLPVVGKKVYIIAEGELYIPRLSIELGPFDSITIHPSTEQNNTPMAQIESKGKISECVYEVLAFEMVCDSELVCIVIK